MYRKVKNILKPLASTPFHPQWLTGGNATLHVLLGKISGARTVLDIGCFNKWPLHFIEKSCCYIGLDYYETASQWYKTVPDIYGDALDLPIASQSVDVVLLLDVLEHLADSDAAIKEISRVLAVEGQIIIRVPFLYPLHDEPRDFVRFTAHGLKGLMEKHGFSVTECKAVGHPVETATLLLNIAWTKAILAWIADRNILALTVIMLPVFVLMANLIARIACLFSRDDSFMPHSYTLVAVKK